MFARRLIVALTIPFALLFAATCLNLKGIPANLLSLGALDFGMVVDGAVVMVENIVRHMTHEQNSSRNSMEVVREAAHEVQRPVFYAIAIIITAYLPIFTLQRVEGRLFRPMAWTVAFALLGALMFSMLIAPVLSTMFFRNGVKEWHNPVMAFLIDRYRKGVRYAIEHRVLTVGVGVAGLCLAVFFAYSGVIGSEFLPHLDEGAIWVRGTLASSVGPTESVRLANQARAMLCSFPEVPECTSQVGRPDDGTDATGFFNTEYYVGLKPKEEWRPVFRQDKDRLIAAMDRELEKIPGVTWGFSQPIEDNMEEAVSGVKGELATKVYGDDLKVLEQKADQIVSVMQQVRGIEDLGVFRALGQPNIDFEVDREQAARYQINVVGHSGCDSDRSGRNGSNTGIARRAALRPGAALSAAISHDEGSAGRYPAAVAIRRESLARASSARLRRRTAARKFIAKKTSATWRSNIACAGRDLGGAVEEAMRNVNAQIQLPRGYHIDWEGEYESQKRAQARLLIIVPLTILVIFMIIYSMFRSPKWAALILATVAMASVGGMLALLITGTHFSVSSGVGFLALFGVSVQTGVIMLEYINQLRARGGTIEESAIDGAVLRLRPIMMTMLVATLGLLPAALSHAIGSDSQRPFAIVIVGGLMVNLAMSIFILPTLYVWLARDGDKLPEPEPNFEP